MDPRHWEWRSDIIILLRDSPPSLSSTANNFYSRANELRFCSLPLHAMGPIKSDDNLKLYFSDLYISSYTPKLTALIEAKKPGAHTLEKPSILLVAQPDESMSSVWEEISLVQRLKTTVTTLISEKATPSAVTKALQDHQFAHFSCHGTLQTGKPFDASFKLHEDKRLTLLDIVRSRLPSAEFAFLYACHTAELTEESIADEGLHPAAGSSAILRIPKRGGDNVGDG